MPGGLAPIPGGLAPIPGGLARQLGIQLGDWAVPINGHRNGQVQTDTWGNGQWDGNGHHERRGKAPTAMGRADA